MQMAMNTFSVTQQTCARIPADEGQFQLCYYSNSQDSKEHLALVMGDVADQEDVLVRVHSECFTGDVLGSLRCDCGPQLHEAMRRIAEEGRGVLLYLRQEGRGIGLLSKLRAYNLQDQGLDTVDANLALGHQADEREYSIAALMLADLGIRSIRLLTNNPAKIENLRSLGVTVTDRVSMPPAVNNENAVYLMTKVRRMRHMLNLNQPAGADALAAEFGDLPMPMDLLGDLTADAADHLARTGRPLVTAAYAQSIDGSLTATPGRPTLLSGPESLLMTHTLRATHDAILVGIGTVMADNPQLTVRLIQGRDPQPVILDSHLRISPTANLFGNSIPPWIAVGQEVDPAQIRQMEADGARVFTLPQQSSGGIDLDALLDQLGQQGICSLMVEGGSRVLQAFLRQGLADQAVITVAPIFLGGPTLFSNPSGLNGDATPGGLHPTGGMPRISQPSVAQLGRDTIIWGKIDR
jgi:3,4-dihydroxy 2-butanone 4-phosphate synthase/GTP cyclohydrolase II